MRREFVYPGLSVLFILIFWLTWLWQPEHQVRLHSNNLLQSIAGKDWAKFAGFIAEDYHDQWGNDRALVLERTREVFRYLRRVQLMAVAPDVRVEQRHAHWSARVTIEGDDTELMVVLKERINSLDKSFELEWQRISYKPWDWKLVRARNEALVIPPEFQ